MKLFDGFVQSMKNDELMIPKIRWDDKGLINENQKAMDIVPGFPANKRMKYDQKKMIQAIQYGMIILIQYRGTTGKSRDRWKGGRERVIQPMNLGVNKNTKNELLRAWHVDGYSVSQKKNVKKVWRLFNTKNILSMTFVNSFFRLPARGYRMNDRIFTEKKIASADFNQIRKNQDQLIKANKIEKEEDTTIGKKETAVTTQIQIKNTGTVLNLSDPWSNEIIKDGKKYPDDIKISILKTIFTNDYLAIVGALGEKNKTVKVYEDKKLLGSYKTLASFTGKEIQHNKRVNGIGEFDLYAFEKKL